LPEAESDNYFFVSSQDGSISGLKVVATAITSGSVPVGVRSCPFLMKNLKPVLHIISLSRKEASTAKKPKQKTKSLHQALRLLPQWLPCSLLMTERIMYLSEQKLEFLSQTSSLFMQKIR
jgi:hypothetical protein